MMAVIYASIMLLWQWGSVRKHAHFDSNSIPLDAFLRMSDHVCSQALRPCPGIELFDITSLLKFAQCQQLS